MGPPFWEVPILEILLQFRIYSLVRILGSLGIFVAWQTLTSLDRDLALGLRARVRV